MGGSGKQFNYLLDLIERNASMRYYIWSIALWCVYYIWRVALWCIHVYYIWSDVYVMYCRMSALLYILMTRSCWTPPSSRPYISLSRTVVYQWTSLQRRRPGSLTPWGLMSPEMVWSSLLTMLGSTSWSKRERERIRVRTNVGCSRVRDNVRVVVCIPDIATAVACGVLKWRDLLNEVYLLYQLPWDRKQLMSVANYHLSGK